MAYPLTAKANSYARAIISGKIPACIQVRQACQRHLDNLSESTKPGNSYPYKFDKNKSERILDFAQQMKHVKGKWAGQFLQLEPWQCFFMGVSFGWVRKEDGFRRFREIDSEIPRKNSKSTMAAIIGLYMFAMDGEQGAEVYSAATSEAQAFEIFRPAWKMTKNAPDFRECFNISQGGSDKNPGNIYSMTTGSRFETVIGKPGDGSSPHAWLLDEFHEAKTEESYDTGKTGMGARSQPLMVVITTAGTNTAFPCYALRKNCEKVLSGELVNEELFALIYTIDPEDNWTDINTWRKANPNYGVSIYADFLESQRKTAIQDPRKQNIIKCKHLNMWSNAGDAWMNMVEWNQCYDPEINIEQFHGKPVFIGLDLASKIDIAAKIYVFKKGEVYYVFSQYYIPEDRTFDEEHAHYAGWVHEGYIEATPGSRIDIDAIQESIKQDAKDFGLSGSENGSG